MNLRSLKRRRPVRGISAEPAFAFEHIMDITPKQDDMGFALMMRYVTAQP